MGKRKSRLDDATRKQELVYSGREGRKQKKRGHQNVIYGVLHLVLVMAVLDEVTIPILFTAESP